MNAVLTPENRLGLPDIPEYTQNKGGILAPKDYDGISLPRDAGKVLTPKGYSGEQGVSIPQGDEVIKYGVLGGSVERKNISPSEIALAFGNFDVYFEHRIQEYFPSHEKLSEKPARLNYERVYEEKMYFDRSLGRRESIRLSKPGPVEEECVVAVRIASDPSFVGTSVAKKAIDKASALLYSGRTETDKGYQQQLPEMPALLAEAYTYLGRLHTQKGLRYEVYDLLDQIRVPASEISTLGILMDQNGDLKHPLAYRLLAESTSDSEFYEQQLERREKILSLLSGDAEKMTEMYPYLKDLASGVVCSMDLKNPPNGRVGLELEFGLGTTGTLGCPLGFITYNDYDNREISRDVHRTILDKTYLTDLHTLSMYLKDGATHISSLHLHLDMDLHPYAPYIGQLLGNAQDSTVEEGRRTYTWEIRGLLPPARGNELDPACIADVIQLYIAASAETPRLQRAIKLLEGVEPELEQVTFAHICRFVSSPEGRLAALKILEHPLVLKGVNPEALLGSFVPEDKETVYRVLKAGLSGKYARRSLSKIGRRYGFESIVSYERLTEQEITDQYDDLTRLFTEVEILQKLESGGMGIVGIDGKEYPIPSLGEILLRIHEQEEILVPKMQQGFRRLLVVPFGMKLEDLANIHGRAILQHHRDGKLFAPKEDIYDRDVRLDIDASSPVWSSTIYRDADVSGEMVYYPDKHFDYSGVGKTKQTLLEESKTGWRVSLVEDLPILPVQGYGEDIGGRLQLEAGMSPRDYLEQLSLAPMYVHEVGMTTEDWLTYALIYLNEKDQVIDDLEEGFGTAACLPGAYSTLGYVPVAYWQRSSGVYLYDNDPYDADERYGVRVAVRVS